ncbi:MAG: PAS domain S-box protein, partial [Methanomicrobiales archaeon]
MAAQFALEESRDRYIDLYEFAPTGYLTFTDKALITVVNLTAAVLLGVERNDLVNHGLGRFIAPGDHEVWDQYFTDLLNQGKKLTCTLTLMRGDGSTFPARLEGVRTSSSGGTTTIRIAISDITDIWQITALQEREEKYRRLFETAQDGIIIVEEETGKIIDVNT